MSKASFVSLLVRELRLAKNFPIDLTDPVHVHKLRTSYPENRAQNRASNSAQPKNARVFMVI